MRFFITSISFLLIAAGYNAQQIEGTFKFHLGQEITLFGYEGLETIVLAKSQIDATGYFMLNYRSTPYTGMAYIETSDKSQLYLVLNEPEIYLKGTHLKELDSIRFNNSTENLLFTKYAIEHRQRENALAGWKHILPQYQTIFLFNKQKEQLVTIQKEIVRIEKEDVEFLKRLDKGTYVSWYLPLRKLLDDIPLSVKLYTNRISNHLSSFRQLDFNNPYLYTSGIFDDLLDEHYWLIENSGMTIDSMYRQMNVSTEYLLNNLSKNKKLFNGVVKHLFYFLEERSLFTASEYLALNALNQNKCTLNTELSKQLETYRVMKVGNTAPDIFFNRTKNRVSNISKLSDIKQKYILVVFGSSWCQQCKEEVLNIKNNYEKWKLNGLETVFISLDTDKGEYLKFVQESPFLSYCDFKGWDTKAAQDYYVFSTPIFFLLDNDREIILRPNSIEQFNTWFNYKIQ